MSYNENNNETSNFEAELDYAVASAKRKNFASLLFSLVIVGGLGYWLFDAHKQITSFDATTAAQYATGTLQESLPDAARTIEQKLIEAGPQVATQLENQLMKLPDQLADDLVKYTDEELARVAPQIEDELYRSLTTALAQAQLNLPKAPTDEARFTQLVDVLADVYATESIKLVTDVRTKYNNSSADLYTYLDFLATGESLDRRQQYHRDMIETFLALAATYKRSSEAVSPAASVN